MSPSPEGETPNAKFNFSPSLCHRGKPILATPPSPSLGMREAVEDCFVVLYTRKMKFNKEKLGQNKAPEHQASSHTSLQNQDFSKDYKVHKYLILINPTVVIWSRCAPNGRRSPNIIYVPVSLKLPTEKCHSLTPHNTLWSFVALDIHVQSELAKSYQVRVLK